MSFSPRQRWMLAATVACAVALATSGSGRQTADLDEGSRPPDPKASAVQESTVDTRSADSDWVSKLRRTPIKIGVETDLFSRRTVESAVAAAAATPAGPPLFPYSYMGRMIPQEGQTLVFLTKGDAIVTAVPGKKLDAQYRVDAIQDDGLELTYLPLNRKITVAFASMVAPIVPASAAPQARLGILPADRRALADSAAAQIPSNPATAVYPAQPASLTPSPNAGAQYGGFIAQDSKSAEPEAKPASAVAPQHIGDMEILPPPAKDIETLKEMGFQPPPPGATMPIPLPK